MGNVNTVLIKGLKGVLSENSISEEGRDVQRYNIVKALLEYYFIPRKDVSAYESARFKQDLNAHKKFGTLLIIPGI